jgi:4-alpha-glucanotransferase
VPRQLATDLHGCERRHQEHIMNKPGLQRAAGILLHPTSLPGRFGIGDLGPAAYAWVDTLAQARLSWWQLLPLGPTGAGDSPYQSFSSFAGNTLLLSPEALGAEGLLSDDDLERATLPAGLVDYGTVIHRKGDLLERAWKRFQAGSAASAVGVEFAGFREQQAHWLDDLALFLALKHEQGGRSWFEWPEDLLLRRPPALAQARQRLQSAIDCERFGQFLFFRQWQALKVHAHGKGVHIIGDLPIFVAGDSVDVWTNPELFQLDERRQPRVVAGVPPDYFSVTGQLWGNPHYDWQAMRRDGYAWWVNRLRGTLAHVDLVRLDHFRGFVASWEVPAGSTTAQTGHWAAGPGADLLAAFEATLGKLPLIAEDLGVITPEVEALRRRFGLPGMRVLQFTFGGFAEERFLPHNFTRPTVVYTGTHDNDTTLGWFAQLAEADRRAVRRYFPALEQNIAWDLIRAAWASVADLAIAPLQDVLSLGTEARMNYPGKAEGNWRWRCREEALLPELVDRLAQWNEIYQRTANPGARQG